MEIIGIVFYKFSKLYIIKSNNVLYCGEHLFIYDNFEQAQAYVDLIKLEELPSDCVIKFFDYRIRN